MKSVISQVPLIYLMRQLSALNTKNGFSLQFNHFILAFLIPKYFSETEQAFFVPNLSLILTHFWVISTLFYTLDLNKMLI